LPYYGAEDQLLLLPLQDWDGNDDKEDLFLMGFLRPILLIMFLTGLSLAGLVGLDIILPDAFGVGSGVFLLYVVGVSLIFLFFLKTYRKGGPSEGGKEPRAKGTPEDATQHSSDTTLEKVRDRIRDRKRLKK
jgi:hypothetical protein